MEKERILVVDDDREIVKAIEIFLKGENYDVICAYNGKEAVDLIKEGTFNLILMDVMMPEMDGVNAVMKIRETSTVPIIFISAKSEDIDKILGLNVGADDYIAKPFNPLELIARVKSQLRRSMKFNSKVDDADVLEVNGLVLDRKSKSVMVFNEEIKITPTEFRILELFMTNLNRVFSIDEIYEKVWNESSFQSENTIAVHIRRLREKIEIDPKNPKYIKVVWGLGYKIENK